MKIGLLDLAALAALVAVYFGFRSGKLNPASRDNVIYQSTGELGTKIPDWFGGIFKSDAEKKVDEMLGQTTPQSAPSPKRKDVVTPADEFVFVPGSYYDLGQKPVPVDASRVIGKSGVLTDSKYRDLVR